MNREVPSAGAGMSPMRVMGFAGWSGAGKTTVLRAVIPVLVGRGVRVSTVKHAHHEFDVDQPGKDSYEHRQAGAGEVLVASSRRWALMHENAANGEPSLADLLGRLSPCDLVLIEGFKREPYPKIEIYREVNGKPALHPGDPSIVAVATDRPYAGTRLPVLPLDDPGAIADFILARAVPVAEVVAAVRDGAALRG